jgi:hypothetical protein
MLHCSFKLSLDAYLNASQRLLTRLVHAAGLCRLSVNPDAFCAAGQLDAALQGWDIDAENVEICRDAKGEPWLLGEGSYGKVRAAA